MNWEELCAFVDAHRKSIPPQTRVVTAGHYGEIDGDINELLFTDLAESAFSSKPKIEVVQVCGDFSPSYPEQD